MSETDIDRPYKRGDRGDKVKAIQEWLGLQGIKVKIDGDFGPITESAVKRFQTSHGLESSGIVNERTFAALVAPMKAALLSIPPGEHTIGSLTLAYAEQHLKQHPQEIGGQNCGPWVRLYTGGHEGKEWPWCAAFASFCLKQACETLKVTLPIKPSPDCDALAQSARREGRLLEQPSESQRSQIKPGALFLVKRGPGDWHHAGIVSSADATAFHTVEGNTNDEGTNEGYEVCARVRGYANKDFVLI